ncbi:vomeronasal type-2 receptor 116 [Cricetulus griseus]|uniref:Vomeronasal type-2 receptor 116 n=1 Tax=Cricetulus griseus TaxID=10029 RepID=A0A9J7FVT5_CRIGR|nr:vomeronasal type-2 receptor 116 [Cricetulus griseus]XP_027269197.1 vomeronasal type-2 receptor 116 [Cricetulus griseus]
MMFSWIFIFWLLQTHVLVCTFDDSQCSWKTKLSRYSDGNVVISAFVPLSIYYILNKNIKFHVKDKYFEQFNLNNYQCSLAFIFATEEINRNPHLLPNTSLGFELYDIQRSEWDFLREAFLWLTGMGTNIPNYTCRRENKVVALLTGASWVTSARIGRLLNLYKYPQLSFGHFDSILSDRGQFSYLYQTAAKDSSLSLGIISLLLHFSWTWVGLVLIDNLKGIKILSKMRGEMYRKRVCVAFVEMVPENLFYFDSSSQKTLKVIMESSANVVIIYDDRESLHCIMLVRLRFEKIWKVWVMNSKFDVNIIYEPFIFDSFHGSLLFTHHHDEISDFRKFIQAYTPSKYPDDQYIDIFWKILFNCSFFLPDCKVSVNCLPNASLEMFPSHMWEMHMTEASYNIYNSVYAVAHSLHEMTLKQLQTQPHRNGERTIHPWELHPFLKKIHFKNGAGHHVALDSQMKLDEEYDILNFWNFPNGLRQNMKVGTFSFKAPHGHQLFLSDHMIQWSTGFTELPRSMCSESCVPGFRKSSQEVEPTCCYDCAPCPENEISNETDMDNCVKCPESHYANAQQNHCLEKAVTFLSYEDPLGKALSCVSLGCSLLTVGVLGVFVKHYNTPIVKANNRSLTCILLITLTFCFLCPLLFIGHPNTAICVLQQSIFAVLFTVALSTVLAKTLTVVLAFKATVPGRMVRWLMISRAPNFIIPICTIIQLGLCGIWLSISPPFVDSDAYTEHGHVIILCNKGSELAFHCVLGYLCSLALGSYTMAYFSMNLPDTFNEAKFLTFSMLMFFSVWVTFLPVYHSTKGKVMLAMEVFAILASNAGLLGCIFAPKCYIILLRPERNSLHCMKSKAHSRREF